MHVKYLSSILHCFLSCIQPVERDIYIYLYVHASVLRFHAYFGLGDFVQRIFDNTLFLPYCTNKGRVVIEFT